MRCANATDGIASEDLLCRVYVGHSFSGYVVGSLAAPVTSSELLAFSRKRL